MSEESRRGEMDIQKNYRSAPALANSTDPKSRDGTRANPSPRYSKKSYGGNKSEPLATQRKAASQRSKSTTFFSDKRPRSRNPQLGGGGGGRRDEVTNTQRAEFGSVLPQGSKKMNLNHLLNFTLIPRQSAAQASSNYASWRQRNRTAPTRHSGYNKEHFLQANCQFVVKSSGDYSVHAEDPDVLVDWDLIEQVRIFSHEVPSCPICLYPPNAAQVTRCGHIYCWACILHYLALGERSWRKCPICYEAIHKGDLKSVVATENHHYAAGETITMKLMKREKTSLVTLPRPQWTAHNAHTPFSLGEEPDVGRFVKILVATPDQVRQQIIGREAAELAVHAEDNSDDPLELGFIKAAQEELKEREERVFETNESLKDEAADSMVKGLRLEDSDPAGLDQPTADDGGTGVEEAQHTAGCAPQPFSDEEGEEEGWEGAVSSGTVTPSCLEMEDSATASEREEMEGPEAGLVGGVGPGKFGDAPPPDAPAGTAYHYFYQAEDGQHLYLEAVNARCLAREYGSLEYCPPAITATILHIQHHSMNQELRRRVRYLRHLPLTCEFGVCELKLMPPTVSKKTLDFFAVEIDKKKKVRDKKMRDEKRWEQKIKREEQKKQGKYPKAQLSLGSHQHFPSVSCASSPPPVASPPPLSLDSGSCSGSDPPPLSPGCGRMFGRREPPLAAGSPPALTVGSLGSNSSEDAAAAHFPLPPSFAQMLRQGKVRESKDGAWDRANTKSSQVAASDSGSDSDGLVAAPVYGDAFGDAIQEALDQAAYSTQSKQPGSRKEKKNKKGKKKQLLFTTAIQAHHK